jgi:hypothetical protein
MPSNKHTAQVMAAIIRKPQIYGASCETTPETTAASRRPRCRLALMSRAGKWSSAGKGAVRGHVCRCGRCCIRQSCRARSRPILLAYVSIISATFTSQGNAAILHVVCGAVNRATGRRTAHGLSCSLGATDAVASGVHAGGHRWLPSAVRAPHRTLPTIVMRRRRAAHSPSPPQDPAPPSPPSTQPASPS